MKHSIPVRKLDSNRFPCRFLAAFLLLLTASGAVSASDGLSVAYLEGILESSSGSGPWSSLAIGDAVDDGAVLRLSGGGYAELSDSEVTVSLTADGTYRVASLLADVPARVDFRRALSVRLGVLLKGRQNPEMSVAGVRAAEAADDDDLMLMDFGFDYLEDGRILMEEGRIAEAAEIYEQGMLYEVGEVQRESAFRYGICLQLLGALRESRDVLTSLRIRPDDSFYGEYAIAAAALYIESRQFVEADLLLTTYLSGSPNGDEAQAAWFLSALCREGAGDPAGRDERLRKARDLGADTEIGRVAAGLLAG